MVMSIGYNPFYSNKQKTAEAWLLHTFPADFYGARAVLCPACTRCTCKCSWLAPSSRAAA